MRRENNCRKVYGGDLPPYCRPKVVKKAAPSALTIRVDEKPALELCGSLSGMESTSFNTLLVVQVTTHFHTIDSIFTGGPRLGKVFTSESPRKKTNQIETVQEITSKIGM